MELYIWKMTVHVLKKGDAPCLICLADPHWACECDHSACVFSDSAMLSGAQKAFTDMERTRLLVEKFVSSLGTFSTRELSVKKQTNKQPEGHSFSECSVSSPGGRVPPHTVSRLRGKVIPGEVQTAH